MKQLLQNLRTGELITEEVATPAVQPGHLLIRTQVTLISSGTERMLLEFGKASLIGKVMQQPEKVWQVLEKVRTDGLFATLDAVTSKLDQPIPLGYSNVGRVVAVGDGVTGFQVGDRVVSNGHHAEYVCRPIHLCAKIPEGVSDEAAAFTVVSAIALQGIRLIAPTLGESVAVFGLGLIGLAAGQLLRAHGVRVIGFDPDAGRVRLACTLGMDARVLLEGVDPVSQAVEFSRAEGLDAVLIAATTQSDALMHQAAQMTRKRGRIVLTGVTGLHLQRSDFYEKELSFQVSCSYGPGRYDPDYEEKGNDYPAAYVRWTEQRNFVAVLDALASGQLSVAPLISQQIPFEQAAAAYDRLSDRETIGILLTYGEKDVQPQSPRTDVRDTVIIRREAASAANSVVVGVIGAGQFVLGQLLPGLSTLPVRLKWVASREGVSGAIAARRGNIERHTTDVNEIFRDPEVNAVFIMTRHDTHARLVRTALESEKHVFVEKPLCLTEADLTGIEQAYRTVASCDSPPVLMVGFNRRFAPLTVELKAAIQHRTGPLAVVYTVNAGSIPAEHWTQDIHVGGGRLLGEAVHFVDYLRFLAGSPIRDVQLVTARSSSGVVSDIAGISLSFEDGSIGQIQYLANGSKAFPKERIECFVDGKVLMLDNFRSLKGYGTLAGRNTWRQDKGHRSCFTAFIEAVRLGKESPIAFSDIVDVQRATLKLAALSRG